VKIAFIGGGNMASAIIGGLVSRDFARGDILVVELDPGARIRLTASYGVKAIEAPLPALAEADVIVLAVKPQQMRDAARSIAALAADALVVSIAAGIRLTDLSRWLSGHSRLVRAMPNMPALVHAGISGLFALPSASENDRKAAESLLSTVGATLWFGEESDLDAVTAVSGSGPAYVFYALEALETAARELGIQDGAARSLALWTFVGAAKLAIERAESPAELRAQVTSRGGTTERALEVLEAADVKGRFVDAVKAACERSRELGSALGRDAP
jgi:pyrroline-5-carboxylate reductase